MPLCKSIVMYIASAGPQRVRKVSAKLRDVSIVLKKCGRGRVRSLSLAWAILFTAVSSANNLIHNCCRFERNYSTHDNDHETGYGNSSAIRETKSEPYWPKNVVFSGRSMVIGYFSSSVSFDIRTESVVSILPYFMTLSIRSLLHRPLSIASVSAVVSS